MKNPAQCVSVEFTRGEVSWGHSPVKWNPLSFQWNAHLLHIRPWSRTHTHMLLLILTGWERAQRASMRVTHVQHMVKPECDCSWSVCLELTSEQCKENIHKQRLLIEHGTKGRVRKRRRRDNRASAWDEAARTRVSVSLFHSFTHSSQWGFSERVTQASWALLSSVSPSCYRTFHLCMNKKDSEYSTHTLEQILNTHTHTHKTHSSKYTK